MTSPTSPTRLAVGPLPAAPNCLCHICLADPGDRLAATTGEAAAERGCVDAVLRAGWQVVSVGGGTCACCGDPGGDESGPPFAYTVGLPHRAGHPELAMSGLPPALMQSILNYVAEQVVWHGYRVEPGDAIEGALAHVPLAVDAVSDVGREQLGLWSSWFHRTTVDVRVLVWPSIQGVFAWQPGASPTLDDAQPPAWRIPSPRVDAFAPDPEWVLPIPPDHAVTACAHVCEQGEAVRFVARDYLDEDGECWTVHCGRDHFSDADEAMLSHIAHTVRAAPSLRSLHDLQPGEYAERDDAFSAWRRHQLSP